jgi:hypothetical protein
MLGDAEKPRAKEGLALDERWINATETAVDRWATAFKKEVTDPDSFGPAKAIGLAMTADEMDVTDERSVDRWIKEFNRGPLEERDEFLGDR